MTKDKQNAITGVSQRDRVVSCILHSLKSLELIVLYGAYNEIFNLFCLCHVWKSKQKMPKEKGKSP